jgi:protein SCO1/2
MCNIKHNKYKFNLNHWITGCLIIFSTLASAATTPNHSHHQHMMKNSTGYTLKSEHYKLPDITLLTSNGQPISLKDLLDDNDSIILNFIFTSCTAICPIMSGTFSQVNNRLNKEKNKIKMVSISIDPEYDTPNKLIAYAKKFNANSNWIFLTGDLNEIISIQKAFNAYRGKKMNHAPTTFIRTSQSASWTRLDGFASSAEIIAEYKKLNENKI